MQIGLTEETTDVFSVPRRASVHDYEALWSAAEYCTVLHTDDSEMASLTVVNSEKSRNGAMNRLKSFRRITLKPLHRLRAFSTKPIYSVIKQLAPKPTRSENCISPIAVLLDDVLVEIFILAATTLEEKVALSLVCKRFRTVMMSMRKMWVGCWMESCQTPEQITTIAEGNRFVSLKARIYSPSYLPGPVKTWIAERRLDPEEYRFRYFKFTVGLILSFGPEELEFPFASGSMSARGVTESMLASGNLQNLRSLVIRHSLNAPGAHVLQKWQRHMPLLRNLKVDFVPEATLGRNLVQCSLIRIGKAEIGYLRDFLAAARSLQDLGLRFCRDTQRFYEVCDLPALRGLDVNFIPHPSFGRHLVRFRLLYRFSSIRLPELLDFLSSSSETLQELAITTSPVSVEDPGAIDMAPVVSMPSLVSCILVGISIGPTLVAKLRMRILRTLSLNMHGLDALPSITQNEFRTSLQSMSSLENLELVHPAPSVATIDEIVRSAPLHLDSFSMKGYKMFKAGVRCWSISPAPRTELIHFMGGSRFLPEFMSTFVDYLRTVGLRRTKIRLSNCHRWRNGTFELDDVMSAYTGEDMPFEHLIKFALEDTTHKHNFLKI